ncbi:MAG TPA: hypothetical protein ENJ79_07780 [Gammaproteobacteria bacterium]|nr:hypothetical protein [Gammaproteobacteria bacterium]
MNRMDLLLSDLATLWRVAQQNGNWYKVEDFCDGAAAAFRAAGLDGHAEDFRFLASIALKRGFLHVLEAA